MKFPDFSLIQIPWLDSEKDWNFPDFSLTAATLASLEPASHPAAL